MDECEIANNNSWVKGIQEGRKKRKAGEEGESSQADGLLGSCASPTRSLRSFNGLEENTELPKATKSRLS